jgi:ABC-type multidrug transport system fused ATPase/permease subunit
VTAESPRETWRFLVQLITPYRGSLSLVALALIIQTVARLASPWPLKVVLDSVLGEAPLPPLLGHLIGSRSPLAVLNAAVAATVVIAIVEAAGSYASAYYTASVGQWVAHDLRQTVYAHLQRLSLSFHERQQVGPLISTITDDVRAVQDFASQSLVSMAVDMLTIVGVLVVMFSLNWNFTLIALSVTPLLALFVYRLRHLVRTSTHDVRRRQSEIVSIVQEGLTAIRVVKAFAQGEFERQRLDAKSLESVEAGLRARRIRALLPAMVVVLVATGTAAVLWFGARLVLNGQMSAGGLVVFLAYLSRLFTPIQTLARTSTAVSQASVGLERVRAILAADERLERAPDARVLTRVEGRVEFRNVTFAYVPGRPVLHDISLIAEPGQMIGLVGRSGSGKSTLASLIPRFYDPTMGQVLVDGLDIRKVTARSLRRHIAFVLQETQLFHAPVWQNIAYGSPDASRDEIIAAATQAHAHAFIEALPDGYDTIVGQGGAPLSGGQRQRIGVARAMIRQAPIVVLDEPTSGLDAESEALVFDAFDRLLADRTAFVIAHRLATIRRAEQILVLDQGRIVEHGSHETLAAAGGLYTMLLEERER